MKVIFVLSLMLVLVSCATYKPPLAETQVINGESIIVPPNFDKLPKEK